MTRGSYDEKAQELVAEKPNLIVPWFLMSSYAYYIRNESLLSDGYYDTLAKELYENWDSITHVHKYLIDKETLIAGSLYELDDKDYPTIVKAAAIILLHQLEEDKL